MKIFIDIGHPAHVYYFKNFIKLMREKGHVFFITAREKEFTHYLLENNGIEYVSRGKGSNTTIGKILYILKGDITLLKYALKFKPDVFLSFGSAYAAHVSKLIGKPHIAFDDTEHAKLEHLLYVPFTKCILTPDSFKKNFGTKHIRFAGSMDMAYLHPSYYNPNIEYLKKLQLKNKSYYLLRFVSWSASHDLGQTGFSLEGKAKLIQLLSKKGEVIISSEGNLPEEFKKYSYKGDPGEIHSILQYANLFIGESGSMATEAAVLGTPSIVVNSSTKYFGVFEYISKFGNLFYFDEEVEAIGKIEQLLSQNKLNENAANNAQKYVKETINLTDFMVWFIENFPQSFSLMQKNPNYQYKFKSDAITPIPIQN
jgi:predicted glycosyltransferase